MLKFVTFLFAFLVVGINGAAKPDWRIIGGSDAAIDAVTYQASLRNSNNTYFCGGTIITGWTILTSARCLFGRTAATTLAYVGTNNLDSGGHRYLGNLIKIHDEFDPLSVSNDIGLLILERGIEFGTYITSIQISSVFLGPDVDVTFTGWGETTYPGEPSNSLKTIDVKTLTTGDCQASVGIGHYIDETQICTYTRRGENGCEGDIGSPLVNKLGVVGVYSWGSSPCGTGRPDVFTRVSSFFSWIQKYQIS